jgi:hypothetical protein
MCLCFHNSSFSYPSRFIDFLMRGPDQLLTFDLAPVLQYDTGSSSDFLAKILGVDTPLFL